MIPNMPNMPNMPNIYDVVNPSCIGDRQLSMQAACMDVIARNSIYSPDCCFSLNPRDVFMQYQAQCPIAFGTWNVGMPGLGGFGWNCGGASSSSSDSSKTDKEKREEKEKEELIKSQCEKLESIIKKYQENYKNSLNEKVKSAIKVALEGSASQDKLDALKEVYKELNKENVKKIILTSDDYKNLIMQSGYQSTGIKDPEITEIINEIDQAYKSKEVKAKDFQDYLSHAVKLDKNTILPALSYWNSKNPSLSLITAISKKDKKNVWDDVSPLKEAIIEKCEADYTDNATLTTLKEKVKKSFEKKNLNEFTESFTALYVALRIADAKRINQEIKTGYEFLNEIDDKDKDIITTDLVLSETVEDLRNEGLGSYADKYSDVRPNNDEESEVVPETAEEKVKVLVNSGKLIAIDNVTYDGQQVYINKDNTLYIIRDDKVCRIEGARVRDGQLVKKGDAEIVFQETSWETLNAMPDKSAKEKFEASSDDYKLKKVSDSYYVQDGGKTVYTFDRFGRLRVVKGCTYKGGKIVGSPSLGGICELDKFKKTESSSDNSEDKSGVEAASDMEAVDRGFQTAQYLIKYTRPEEMDIVLNNIETLDKDNIADFMKGYHSNISGGNGLFEQLTSEYGAEGDRIKNKHLIKILDALMGYAEDNNKVSTRAYRAMKNMRNELAKNKNQSAKRNGWSLGNRNGSFAAGATATGAGIGFCIGGPVGAAIGGGLGLLIGGGFSLYEHFWGDMDELDDLIEDEILNDVIAESSDDDEEAEKAEKE